MRKGRKDSRVRESLKRKARRILSKITSDKEVTREEVKFLDLLKDLSDEYYFAVLESPNFENRIKK